MKKMTFLVSRTIVILTIIAGCSSGHNQRVVLIPTAQLTSEDQRAQEVSSARGVPILTGAKSVNEPVQRKPASK